MDIRLILRAVGARAAWLSFTRPTFPVLLLALTLSLLAGLSEAAPCTKGVDCYCDKVKGGNLNDSALLLCEDFEAPTLRVPSGQETARVGASAPYYGPPYDDSGQIGNRGNNGYWFRNYSNGTNGALWSLGNPTNPTYGRPCAFSLCTGLGIWDRTNRWGANSFARAAFVGDDDFNAEVSSIAKPTGRAGGGAGAFDGQASYALRQLIGVVHGFSGGKAWPSSRTIGVTMAVAYPNNLAASNILNGPWKHNEWQGNGADNGMFLFHDGGGLRSTFPFYGFIFQKPPFGNAAACNAALGAATVTRGTFECDGISIKWHPTNYTQSTDWPIGSWSCVRGHYRNFGLSNMAWTISMVPTAGPRAGVEQVVTDISNFDGRFLMSSDGISGVAWNNYSNTNDPAFPGSWSKQITYRYEDNMHVRAGAPVSCAQIGFASSGQSGNVSPPSAPSGLVVR